MGDPERLAGLPAPVRAGLVELAAQVLGELAEAETPPALTRVRLFAPARRAGAGAGPLVAALERDPAFRARVAAAWRARNPGAAVLVEGAGDAGDTGDAEESGAADDPVLVLQGLFLVRPEGWADAAVALAGELARVEEEQARRRGEGSASARVRALEREVERLRDELGAARAAVATAGEELASTRREVRRLRAEADRARAAAREAERAAQADRERAGQELAAARSELEREHGRALAARERAEQAQRAGREGRSLDQARLRLLLDTVVEAATGLRRELALPPVGVRPADLVADAVGETREPATGDAGADRGLAPDHPALLTDLLALPQAHLVVDGYNVTKTAFAEAVLAEQRRRLVEALAAVAARTGAEVTCVFDGAEVDARSALRVRGVRVLFSDPGTTADELIRRLVRAEPPGRPVVVVSSDKEVASGVRAAGARAVPSAALVRLLGRG